MRPINQETIIGHIPDENLNKGGRTPFPKIKDSSRQNCDVVLCTGMSNQNQNALQKTIGNRDAGVSMLERKRKAPLELSFELMISNKNQPYSNNSKVSATATTSTIRIDMNFYLVK